MSYSEQRNWLIAYDIADPLRLGRVHRFLKRHAVPVQYSVFVFQGNQATLDGILSGIAERIDTDLDDVRAYHLPNRCEVTMLGNQHLPEGVMVCAHGLERLLRKLTVNNDGPIVEAVVTGDEATYESEG